jgi:hypothetical protein
MVGQFFSRQQELRLKQDSTNYYENRRAKRLQCKLCPTLKPDGKYRRASSEAQSAKKLKVDIRCEKRERRPREDIHTHKLPLLIAGRSVGKCCGWQVLLINSKQHSFSTVLIFKLLE